MEDIQIEKAKHIKINAMIQETQHVNSISRTGVYTVEIVITNTLEKSNIPNYLADSSTLSSTSTNKTPKPSSPSENISTLKSVNQKYLKLVSSSQINVRLLTDNELPLKIEDIRKKPNELLILHLNSRSILNKLEHLQYMAQGTNSELF